MSFSSKEAPLEAKEVPPITIVKVNPSSADTIFLFSILLIFLFTLLCFTLLLTLLRLPHAF